MDKAMKLMAVGSTKLPISEVTRNFLLFHALIMVGSLATLGPNAFMSWQGVGLSVLLNLAIYCSLWKPNKRSVVILLCAAWFTLLFIQPRLTAFLLFPSNTVSFVAIDPFTPAEITGGLSYIVLGYLALWLGCEIGGRVFPVSVSRSVEARNLSLWGIAVFIVVGLAAAIFVRFGLGVSVYSVDPAKWGSRLGWLARVFDTDAGLVLLLTWLLLNPKRKKAATIVAFSLVAFWLTYALVIGSRGGPIRIMIFTGLAAFAIYGDFLITTRRVIAVLALTIFTSALMYAPASIIRLTFASGDSAVSNFSEAWNRAGPINDDLDVVWQTRGAWVTSPAVQKVTRTVSPILTRLGLVDYPIIVVTRPANEAVIDTYLKSPYALQNFTNNMVLGEVFPGSDIMTSRVFTMAFRNATEDQVRTAFLSEPWTLWGFSWLVGGGIFGGLLIITALTAVTQVGYNLLSKIAGPTFAPYAGSAYLIMAVVSGLLQLFGLDHWLTIVAHFAISMTVGLLIITAIEWVFRPKTAAAST